MIIVTNQKLQYNDKTYKCSIGLNGLCYNKIEGDQKTPIGTYKIGNLFVRTDRVKKLDTKIKYTKITSNMAWSDDSNEPSYNTLIRVNYAHKEALYRRDNLYDLLLVIEYNVNPIIPNKGSAIFIHIARKNYEPTRGCIALKLSNFLELLKVLDTNEKICILK
jgi:L,D-peptidoglycan transpeptidase YkuD (ErfK/YbiS/YcfS/YnhG family)